MAVPVDRVPDSSRRPVPTRLDRLSTAAPDELSVQTSSGLVVALRCGPGR